MVLLTNQLRQWIMVSTFIIISADVVSFLRCNIYSGWGKMSKSIIQGKFNEMGIDRSMCITKCNKKSRCVAASYNHTTKHCGFMSSMYTNIVPDTNTDLIIVKDIKVSTVFLGVEPSFELGQQVQWTVNNASEACTKVGQRLITYQQLLDITQSEEYVYDGCGFVAEGDKLMVLPEPNGDNGLGLYLCQRANYAYCTTY